ncbi:hypothetical protein [uncultured Clostridium sp.]|uniref:hypothetical protein n=1 Tax=uncultured Clostridium sp. TaxID=59620 RepID=UPI00321667BB
MDTLADIAIWTSSIYSSGSSLPRNNSSIMGTALLASSISYGASSLLENKITNLKNSVISGF